MPLSDHIDRFPQQRLLIVGDVILDHYVRGDVSRTSPEAPVPILNVEAEEYVAGGAANVAMNLVALGAKVTLVGRCGMDPAGGRLRALLAAAEGLESDLIEDRVQPTILKTRCVAQGQQMLRLDYERTGSIPAGQRDALNDRLRQHLARADAVILSDYGKGFLDVAVIAAVIEGARRKGIPVLADPKGRDYTRYHGVAVLTPNQREAAEATGIAIADNDSLELAAKRLHDTAEVDTVVITRGPGGVSVFPRGQHPTHIPARAREVYDVTGAGDTFIAVLGLALAAGASMEEAAELGNLAGGYVVGLAGVATISAQQLREVVKNDPAAAPRKHLSAAELEQVCRSHRQHGSRVVFTNGYFDLLHYGHIRLLEAARGMGDTLVVAINSDDSVRRGKGEPRPLLSAEERAAILSALPFVDYVTVFEEDTPEELLRRLRPDVLVKGAPVNSPNQRAVGQEIVEEYGGEVRFVSFEGVTTTASVLARVGNTSPESGKIGQPEKT